MNAYYTRLNEIVDKIFGAFGEQGWTYVDIVKKSKLSYQTVKNLDVRKTKFPHFKTVFLLARCIGFDIAIIKKIKSKKSA